MRTGYEMGKLCAFGATLMLCLAAMANPARARDHNPFMTVGAAATPPSGHRQFCRDHPEECRSSPTGSVGHSGKAGLAAAAPAPVALTTAMILSIAAVNTAVNASVRPQSDLTLYGVEEHWAYPIVTADGKTAGDCEDFVLLKRKMLREIDGIALGDLLITVVRKHDGEGHAVLTLRTTKGDFILDNLDWRIRDFADTPYRYLKRQDPVNPAAWSHIEDGKDLVVSAVQN